MTVRIGLIAASRIAQQAVIDPAPELDGVEVVAVAARDADRAGVAAERWGLERSFGSYDELLAWDGVDAVYVATPASLHREWTVAALEAGKHVLVEKPLAANAPDARVIEAAAAAVPELVAMEAFHWRYHPLVRQMRDVLDSGVLGNVERVDAAFELGVGRLAPTDIRWQLELGGGATMDLGVYALGWVTWVMGERPEVVSARAECPVPEVDGTLEAELRWPDGVQGTVVSSLIAPRGVVHRSLIVTGDRGTMAVDNPVAPQFGTSLTVEANGARTEYPVERTATYLHQLAAFRDAIVHDRPFPTTIAAGVEMMELIDACYTAAGLQPRPTWPG